MGDGDALLARILADPGDDTVRLVYADWLEENGRSERAGFVRVQIEIARHPGMNCGSMYCSERGPEGLCDDCRRFKRLRKRERELAERHAHDWDGPPVPWTACLDATLPPALGHSFVFRRGFVEAVTCTAADWLAHGDALLAAHPVTEVTLTTRPTGREYGDLRARIDKAGRECRRRLLPRGMGRHNAHWYAFWDNPDPLRVFKALWPRVKVWHLPDPTEERLLDACRHTVELLERLVASPAPPR